MTRSVRDIMRQGLITCRPDTSLGQVAVLLARHHVHALVVADKESHPLGIISDFDLLAGEWLSVDNESLSAMRTMTAGELMSSPIDSIGAEASLQEAAQLMIGKQIHRMLVTENGIPTGILSISDLVASIAQRMNNKRLTVGDVMSDAFLVCRGKTPITSAARTMTRTHWRSVIVVDARGKPQGVVTGRDLLRFVGNNVDEGLCVNDVMNPRLTTISINASLHEAANKMIQNHQHRLIVIDENDPDGFPLGIISSSDIVAEMARPGSVWQV